MTIWFQIVLIFVSIMTCVFILRSIRKSQVQINDAIFWVFFSLILLLINQFQLTLKLSKLDRKFKNLVQTISLRDKDENKN